MKIRIYKQGTWTVYIPRECSIDDKETVLKYWDYDDAIRRTVKYIRDFNLLHDAKWLDGYRPFRTNLHEDQ